MALEQTGTRQNFIAKEIGVTTSTVQRWVKCEVVPSAENLYAISQFLNIPVSFFYDETTPSQEEINVGATIEALMAQLDEYKKNRSNNNIEDLELQKIAERIAKYPHRRKFIFQSINDMLDVVEKKESQNPSQLTKKA